jgi:UDP-glucuronate 4-epimerase
MALFLFAKNILEGKPIDVFNHGQHKRDFTFVADIVEGRGARFGPSAARPDATWNSDAPDPATQQRALPALQHRQQPAGGTACATSKLLEDCPGRKAEKNFLPLQQATMPATWADIEALQHDVGYTPATPVEEGIAQFVKWYKEYYAK